MNKQETVTLLQTLIAYYPTSRIKADRLTVSLYHEALKDLPGEVVSVAVKRMVSTLKFPPTVADIREAVANAVQDARNVPTAGEAWAKVKKAASWYGYYRPKEARAALGDNVWRIVQQVGGWREICAGEDPEGVISAHFERRYNAAMKQEAERVQIPENVREEMTRLVEPLVDKLRLNAAEEDEQ